MNIRDERYVIKTELRDVQFGGNNRTINKIIIYDTSIQSEVYHTYYDGCSPFEMCDRLNRDHRALMFEEEVYLEEVCGYAEMIDAEDKG